MKVSYFSILFLSLSLISCHPDEPIFIDYASDLAGRYSGIQIRQYYTTELNYNTTNIEAEIIQMESENTIRIVFTPTYASTDGFLFTYIDGMWHSDIPYHPATLTIFGDTVRFNHCPSLAPNCWTMILQKTSD